MTEEESEQHKTMISYDWMNPLPMDTAGLYSVMLHSEKRRQKNIKKRHFVIR
jgi:hypothetical protein